MGIERDNSYIHWRRAYILPTGRTSSLTSDLLLLNSICAQAFRYGVNLVKPVLYTSASTHMVRTHRHELGNARAPAVRIPAMAAAVQHFVLGLV